MIFKNKKSSVEPVEITLIPMIDLFMNILVFFLVTTSFSKETLFQVNLPQATQGQGIQDDKLLDLFISPDGRISLNTTEMTVEDLKKYLCAKSEDEKKAMSLFVKADEGATHGMVIKVLDAISHCGIVSVGLAAQKQ